MTAKDVTDYLAEIGRKGGSTKGITKVRGDAEYYRRISQLAAKARKRNARRRAKGTKSNGR